MQALSPRPIPVVAPALPRRLPRPAVGTRALVASGEAAALCVLAAATVAARVGLRPRFLFNWDAIQFALGVQRFDLAAHRPHPPGYLGYIVAGRLFTGLAGGDAQRGLVLLSALATAAAVVIAFLAARDLWGRFPAWAAAVLIATSPLTWLYGATALSYALEPPFAILTLWLAVRAVRGDRRATVLAAVVAAAAGAIRPTDEAFLAMPLAYAAWRLWRHDRRVVLLGLAAAVVTTLSWLVPLVLMSGGPARYLLLSRELSARASATSAVWKMGFYGLQLNGGAVAAGLAMGLGVFATVAAAHALVRRVPGVASQAPPLDRDYSVLAAWLLLPALGVYVLVHIGQLGYLLLLLPALVLPAGVFIRGVARLIGGSARALSLSVVMLSACALANVATFALPDDGARAALAGRDDAVGALLSTVREYDPSTTLVVTSAEANGSYRVVDYYLPAYRVVALGRDQHGNAGEMFAAHFAGAGAPEYDLARFNRAAQPLLPPGVRTVLFLDGDAARMVGDFGRLSPTWYGDEQHAWVAPVGPAARLLAAGRFVYLDPADCPCRGAGGAHQVHVPGEPL